MRKQLFSILMSVLMLLGLLDSVTALTVTVSAAEAGIEVVPAKNVALNAQVTASGQCNVNERPQFAVDGKNDTKWCDNTTAKIKWMKLDLGKEYTINQWTVYNAGINESSNSPFWNTQNFRLQKSADGVTWSDVDVVQGNVQTVVDRYLPEPVTARYLRFYVSKAAANGDTVRLYELQVYGVDAGKYPAYPAVNLDPVDYVDPLINTLGDNGQTNPGPSTPFGLVSLGPDSDGGAFSGYYYQDKYLKGFSQVRFSGVGCSGAGGNILMMPETRSFTKNVNEYKQLYDKNSEQASAGYYGVTLASGIGVELTASDNVGFQRYTFPASAKTGSVLVDLSNSYAGMLDASLKVEGSNEITGMVQSKNVCGNGYYKLYYSIQFDHDFNSYTSWQGDVTGTEAARNGANSGVWVNFDTDGGKVIQAKVGLSAVSVEQARAEVKQDIADWDFDAQHAKIRSTWSEVLGKVEIKDNDEENKKVFYTQMYHTYLHPKNVTSSAGTFKAGRDENTVRQASELGEDFEYYNGWTTWDDFRKYSLFSVLEPQKYTNMVKSLVDLYKTRGTYTQWGDGYWPSPTVRNEFNGAVILDAYAKGFTDYDVYTALKGMTVDADNFSISDGEISGKLEKAKSAYFPMKLAALLGDKGTYEKYKKLALSYQDLWNANQVDENGVKTGFFTPNGTTVAKGDVTAVDKYAYQGNLWTYRWSATQDINGLAKLMGGKTEMAKQLQDFFARDEYMAINEPDIDVPYLFNYLGYPYLTQYYAREYTTEVVTQKYHNHGPYAYPIQSRVYRADPEGYLPSMDDDAGGMSSWFVYSAMGLFPGNPGDANFLIGSPIFSELTLHLDNGKMFTMKANNVSSDNRFIQSAKLNGQSFDQAWISYDELMSGGTLEFEMGSEPDYAWGASAKAAPPTVDYSADIENTLSHTALISSGSEWKYYDKGKAPASGWTGADFNDSSWSSGQAPLGYDNKGYAKTLVGYGPDASKKYTTTYFRTTFNASDLQDILELDAGLIRDDGAAVYLNGHEIIRTNMPDGAVSYDTNANATVGDERNWNRYEIDSAYLKEGINVLAAEVHQVNFSSSDIAFDFSLEAAREMVKPGTPSTPLVDDDANTFGWTAVPGYTSPADYEYSTDGGVSWKTAAVNPQTVGPQAFAAGDVQVRVKADEARNVMAGDALVSDKPYTSDILWNVYDLKADVKRTGNMTVEVSGTLQGAYTGPAVAVIQLMDGGEQALLSSAVPVQSGGFELTQSFGVIAKEYQVNVYLVDSYNGNIYDSLWLADPIESKPETAPQNPGEPSEPGEPGGEQPGGENPLPDPLPVPVKTPVIPDPAEEPQPPVVDMGTVEFENRTAWSDAVNTFNNNKLKTEDGNNGTVVANTFTGAWLSFADLDFGTKGTNRITAEYNANSDRTPADAVLELRLGAVDGELLGTLELKNTGAGWTQYKTASGILNRTLTGKQTLFFVLKGSTDSNRPYIANLDKFIWDYQAVRTDYAKLELENYDAWSTDNNPANGGPLKTENGTSGKQVANTFSGAWLAYKGMNFGSMGVNQWALEYTGNSTNTAADSSVEVRLGGVDGELVGTLSAPPTANAWGTYKTVSGALSKNLTGMQDIYLVFKGTTDSTFKYIGNFDNASFSLAAAEPDVLVEFENKTVWSDAKNTFNSNPLKTEGNNGGTVVANTFTGAWFSFENVDFGVQGKNYVSIQYDAPTNRTPADITAEIRLGGKDGTVIGTVSLPNTGGAWGNYKTAGALLSQTLSGKQNLYVSLKGSTTSSLSYVGNLDKLIFTKK
ncbi:glycoside hydrolase domain-containing protein [Paenibacillus borealis]|uniref:Alpha-1,2-mannosidase n=1 Tax=Paenibacillus borealis TaxID=160799 RepID=A0A089L9N7_PAEBO|nr:glycoside hydrolase domain-containing protein [Paenibacillus borealis]AIQ55858.1 alpha-1,2-mannosidase [Paenibacillus borealis]